MNTNTYTIEVTENDLNATLADLNIYRMDAVRDGFEASAEDTRDRAEDMIRQALEQGFDGGVESSFGGRTVRADDRETRAEARRNGRRGRRTRATR